MHHALLALVAATSCTLLAAQNCLDQSYNPTAIGNGLEVTADQTCTQTFTVGTSGTLLQVDVPAINHHRGTPTQPLEVRIVTTGPAGVPSGPALATVVFQPNQVPAQRGRLSIDLRPFAIPVTAGMVLGLRLSTAAPSSAQTYAWWGNAPADYPRGQIYISDTVSLSVWDLTFETFVDGVASRTNYGVGHPGSAGVPALTASANPALGTTVGLVIGNAAGLPTQAAVFVGLARSATPTAFGGTFLVQPAFDVVVQLGATGVSVPIAIPNDPGLCQVRIDWQAIHGDPGASHGLAFTRGLEWILGR